MHRGRHDAPSCIPTRDFVLLRSLLSPGVLPFIAHAETRRRIPNRASRRPPPRSRDGDDCIPISKRGAKNRRRPLRRSRVLVDVQKREKKKLIKTRQQPSVSVLHANIRQLICYLRRRERIEIKTVLLPNGTRRENNVGLTTLTGFTYQLRWRR